MGYAWRSLFYSDFSLNAKQKRNRVLRRRDRQVRHTHSRAYENESDLVNNVFVFFAGWQEAVAVVPVRYVAVDVGKGLKLACAEESALPTHSDESVGVMWIREDREDEQIERLKVEPNGVLELLNVTAHDAGNYSCTLDDDHDAVKARINVEVRSML